MTLSFRDTIFWRRAQLAAWSPPRRSQALQPKLIQPALQATPAHATPPKKRSIPMIGSRCQPISRSGTLMRYVRGRHRGVILHEDFRP
jgi:hypothetical protein